MVSNGERPGQPNKRGNTRYLGGEMRQTTYELTWGSDNGGSGTRYFSVTDSPDHWVRFAGILIGLDTNPEVGGGWVHLKRLPDSIYPEGQHLAAWTKCSNERPTTEGLTELPA